MFSRGSILAGILVLASWFGVHDALAQGVFTLSSPGFKDGERLATKNGYLPRCISITPSARSPSPAPWGSRRP